VTFRLLTVGAAWGLIALIFGSKAFGPVIWGGVLASPLIGLAAGRLTHARFEQTTGVYRGLAALASVYAGAVLFGVAIGLYDLAWHSEAGRAAPEVIGQAMGASLWGATVFLIALWPMAYLTHLALAWSDE